MYKLGERFLSYFYRKIEFDCMSFKNTTFKHYSKIMRISFLTANISGAVLPSFLFYINFLHPLVISHFNCVLPICFMLYVISVPLLFPYTPLMINLFIFILTNFLINLDKLNCSIKMMHHIEKNNKDLQIQISIKIKKCIKNYIILQK